MPKYRDYKDAHVVHGFQIGNSPMSRELLMDLDVGQGQGGMAQGAVPQQGGAQAAGVDQGAHQQGLAQGIKPPAQAVGGLPVIPQQQQG